ncbi:MAG: PAS domain S-box protein, partial [Anaerolineales bacterium]|nr:PAS domain S-box protein [Anaerolineales bacterium]
MTTKKERPFDFSSVSEQGGLTGTIDFLYGLKTRSEVNYLDALALHLNQVLAVDTVLLGHLLPGNTAVETAVFWHQGQQQNNITYDLAHTPSAKLDTTTPCLYPKNVSTHFPQDPLLTKFKASAYASLPICDMEGKPIGLIVLLKQTPFDQPESLVPVLKTVALNTAVYLLEQDHQEKRHLEEERHNLLISALGEGIVFHDKTGQIVTCNHSAERILGLSYDQLIGRTSIDPRWRAIHLDGSPFPGETHPAVVTLKTGEPQEGVIMGVHKPDGSLTWISINSQPLRQNPAASPYGVVALFTDITAQVMNDQRVRLLSKAVDQSPVAIAVIDQHTRIQYINRAFAQMARRDVHTLLGQSAASLFNPSDPTDYNHMWEEAQHGRTWQGEFLYQHPNGELQWKMGTIAPIRNLQGQFEHVLAIVEDITELRHLQETLHQRNVELQHINRIGAALGSSLNMQKVVDTLVAETQTLLNTTAVSLWLKHPDLDCLVCTQATANIAPVLVGKQLCQQEGLTGRAWAENHYQIDHKFMENAHGPEQKWLAPLGQNLRAAIAMPLATNNQFIGVLALFDTQPDYFQPHHRQLIQTLTAIAATSLENALLHQDVQQQLDMLHEAQSRLVQNEKLAALGQLIAGVAHELNNPLSSVILHTELLELRYKELDIAPKLGRIAHDAHRAAAIVKKLLDFARQRPPERKKIDLNKLLADTLELVNYNLHTHNIAIRTNFQSNLPLIWADPHQLQQVFINLVTNAQQAIFSEAKAGQVTISTSQVKEFIQIEVEDNGPGIPIHLQSRIFDPFFTTKPAGKGTGMGLATVYGIVKQNGGHIAVNSIPGEGSSFCIYLPTVDEQSHAITPAPLPDKKPSTGNETLLIVEDDFAVRGFIVDVLQAQGYHLLEAATGEEAIKIATHYTESIQLLVTDVIMPGMNGKVLAEAVRHLQPTVKILFISGYDDDLIAHHGVLDAGIALLQKPFGPT